MQVIREFQKVFSNEVRVHVPDDFLDKDIEITVKTVTSPEKKKPIKERPLFNTLRLNTRGFKFNREEANER